MADPSNTDLLPGLFAPPRLPWESIMDSVRNGVVCVDQLGKVVHLNLATERLFGLHRADALGRPLDFSPELARLFAEAVAGGMTADRDPPFHREFLHQPAGGGGGAVTMSVTISRVRHGDFSLQIGVVRDLTEVKQMEAALVQSRKNQAIGALAGGIAHDFNNILTALLSQLDLALDFPELPDSAREHILHAQTSGRRAAELISRLQTFSRQTENRTTTVDLAGLIEQVVLILRRSIDRRIEIKTDKARGGEWLVKADGSQVIQVIFNLALNARDAMPEGGRLGIKLGRTRLKKTGAADSWVRISVSDTGTGMTPDVRARLFEPYFTTKTLGRGTGLGLSIAQSIVSEQGGWIDVESEPGTGSTFHVFLPETTAGTEPVPLDPLAASDGRALEGSESILIADDEEMVRLVMKAVLSYRGYKISEAENGRDALELARRDRDRLDLILLDVDMPQLNGWEALQRLREELPEVPVIMLSGGAVDSDASKARDRGASGFLAKPFKNEQLMLLVRRTLDEAKR